MSKERRELPSPQEIFKFLLQITPGIVTAWAVNELFDLSFSLENFNNWFNNILILGGVGFAGQLFASLAYKKYKDNHPKQTEYGMNFNENIRKPWKKGPIALFCVALFFGILQGIEQNTKAKPITYLEERITNVLEEIIPSNGGDYDGSGNHADLPYGKPDGFHAPINANKPSN